VVVLRLDSELSEPVVIILVDLIAVVGVWLANPLDELTEVGVVGGVIICDIAVTGLSFICSFILLFNTMVELAQVLVKTLIDDDEELEQLELPEAVRLTDLLISVGWLDT